MKSLPVFRPFRETTEVVLALMLLGSLVLVTPRIAESDAVEYFSYLHSILFDRDLDFANEYQTFYLEDPEGRQGFKETFLDRTTATGLKLNFGPIGTAILWSPFYLVAHLVTLIQDPAAADGLSQPYRTAVAFGSALYGAFGLFLAYRMARRFASSFASFLAILALWWATPVAYYMYIAPGMSHAASLFAVALYFSIWPWAVRGGTGRWVVWGASAGLMALVREQDLLFALSALVPVFSPALGADWPARARRAIAFGATTILVFVPQFLVYQILNGHPSPSPLVQRKMEWISPYFLDVLFSVQHGLFLWSPLLLLFLAGAFLLLRREREAGLILLIGFVSQVYVSGAVESWTQAGAFGARRFVGATAVFAVWGALVFEALRPRLRSAGVVLIASTLILWNVSLMIQFGLNLMSRDHLVWSRILHNHVHEVPPRLVSVAERYFFNREQLISSEDNQP